MQRNLYMMSRRKEKLSLTELTNPLPDDFEDEIDVAKVCDYSEDVHNIDGRRSIRAMILDEDDIRQHLDSQPMFECAGLGLISEDITKGKAVKHQQSKTI